jgi:hypothetical protein
MSAERTKVMLVGMAIIVAVLAVESNNALAQQSGGGVVGGDRLRPGTAGTAGNQRASRSIRHARNYSRDMYRYSRDAERVEPSVAKSDSEELGRNIAKAQKEMTAARQEARNDAAALATLKSVEQHLAAAAVHHKLLHEECCKDSVDSGVCMKHCNQILLGLDKAQAEQDSLIRALEMKAAAPRRTAPPKLQQR